MDPLGALSLARKALVTTGSNEANVRVHALHRTVRRLESDHGSLEGFLRSSIDALSISRVLGDERLIAEDILFLSEAYCRMGQFERELEECQRAMYLLQRGQDSLVIARAHLRILEAMLHASTSDAIHGQAAEAERLFSALNDGQGLAKTWSLVGRSYANDGRWADARPFLKKAHRLSTEIRADTLQARIELDLLDAALHTGRKEEAASLLASVQALVPHAGDRTMRIELLQLRHEAAAQGGRWQEALELFKAYHAATDSVHLERSTQQVAGLGALYELNVKDRDNALLRERNALNETLIAHERRRYHGLLLAFGLLSALVVALIIAGYHLARSRKRVMLKNRVIRRQSDEIGTKNLELKRQNMRLAETLMSEEEKDLLLREIHHRIKNDLQIVSTLLRIHTMGTVDKNTAELLEDTQRRVATMASVHDQLYRSSDLRNIAIEDHLRTLLGNVIRSFFAEDRIAFDLRSNVRELPTEVMMPLGLVLNELVTNSVKHAFAPNGTGKLMIELMEDATGRIVLRYSDDGPLERSAERLRGDGFGMHLIRSLAEQLDGEVMLLQADTVTFQMEFHITGALKAAS
ncbi:MAG: sensor histidine kinase [Flavobacteriales bacterium]|nr:sensor histidine kinase [Flavobacteriales bacterium]